MIYQIPKPQWRFELSDDEATMRAIPYFEEVANGLTRQVWEVEEQVLMTAVVELLRSKGWTVEPPEDVL